jgi:ssDNA-binding Zn-finger/Zn-ribbon topoisomerase 1
VPYLEFLKCEKCGHDMDIDHGATIRAYYEEGRPDKENFLNPATIIWDYLVYACYNCGTACKYTFRDIELKVREYFSVMSQKHLEIFEKLDVVNFDEFGRVIMPTREEYREATTKRLDKAYKK